MAMNSHVRSLVLLVMVLLAWIGIRSEEPADPTTGELFVELDRVASLYRESALGFECKETIYIHTDEGRRTVKMRYIYSRDENGQLIDRRVKRRGDGSGKTINKEIPEIEGALVRSYSWVFLFESSRWPYYRYELQGEEDLDGTPALKIILEPVEPIYEKVNDWYVTLYVDRETYLPLQVQSLQVRDMEIRNAYQRELAADNRSWTPYDWKESITVFGAQHNGLCYPSESRIEMRRHTVPQYAGGQGRRLYRIRQVYGDYRFFKVQTTEGL